MAPSIVNKQVYVSAAEMIGANLDLLVQILICLPARSLLVFRCVSKQWLSLISNPKFQHDHIRRNPNPPTSGLYCTSRQLHQCFRISLLHGSYRSLPPLSSLTRIGEPLYPGEILLEHSFHGLMLCTVRRFAIGIRNIIICNPTTQKCKVLNLECWFPSNWFSWPCLYFDPLIPTQYKIIFVRQGISRNISSYYFDVYTFENETWTTLSYNISAPGSVLAQCRLVSTDGVIHMISQNTLRFHIQFNIETMQFSCSPMIEEPMISEAYRIGYLGENGSKLFLVVRCSSHELMIYEKGKREGSDCPWIAMISFNLTQVLSNVGCSCCGFAVLCATFRGKSGRDLDLVLAVRGKIICYNQQREVMAILCDIPPQFSESVTRLDASMFAHRFIETFFPV